MSTALIDGKGTAKWTFVVDTDSYAGNFEREMAGYVVGKADEEGDHRSGPMIKLFEEAFPKKNPFETLIEERTDTHDDISFHSPMSIAPTPGYFNDGHGEYFKDTATNRKRAKGLVYLAYQSVAIFLARKPSASELKLLKLRALEFETVPATKPWDRRPKILGCRLVSQVTVTKSKPV